jgi:tetratricopeptide (TPR) repeat protein
VVWLDISVGHNDPVVLFSSLFKRFTVQIPGFRDATLERMLRAGEMMPADPSVPITHLLRAMERIFPSQVLVVLDDLHLLTAVPACELLADIIRRAPAGWHWLFCLRPALSDPLAGLLAPGRSAVMGEADLRFSHEEVDRLYRECFGIELSTDQVQRLLDETGGHALMVGLYRLGTRGIQSLIEHLEFVLPSTHWHHLLCWSLLPVAGPVDLDRLLGEGASTLLRELVGQVPSFHVAPGTGGFSMHDVVREALSQYAERVIDDSEQRDLLVHCAQQMLNQGNPLGAARVYRQLGDYEGLECLMRRYGMRLLGQGLLASCRDILAGIPDDVLERSPGLLLLAGSIASLEGRDTARELLDKAVERARERAEPALELMVITRLLEYEGGISGGYEYMDELAERGEKLIGTVLDDLTPTAKAWVHTIFGAINQLQNNDFQAAVRHFTEAESLAVANDLISLQALITYLHFQRHMAQARYPAALMDLERLFQLNTTGRLSGFYGTLFPLALVHWLHFNGLHDEVVAVVRELRVDFRKVGGSGLLVRTFLARWHAESLIALQRAPEARDWLEHVLGGFVNRHTPFLESQLYHMLALAQALSGDAAARQMAEKSAQLRRPFRELHQRTYHQLAQGTTRLILGDEEQAIDWLKQARDTARETGRVHAEATACCYLGLAAWRLEQGKEAKQHFERAARLVQQYRFSYLPGWEPGLMREVVQCGIELDVSGAAMSRLAHILGMGILNGQLVPLLNITTLGEFTLAYEEGTLPASAFTAKQRALLGLLLSQPGFTCAHEVVQHRLYPEASQDQARTNLDTLLSRLRRTLDSAFGKGVSRRYLLVKNGLIVLQNVHVDAHEAERDGTELLNQLRADRLFVVMANGMATRFFRSYRGPFLDLVSGIDEIDRFRDRLHELHRRILDEFPSIPDDYPGAPVIGDLVRFARTLHRGQGANFDS